MDTWCPTSVVANEPEQAFKFSQLFFFGGVCSIDTHTAHLVCIPWRSATQIIVLLSNGTYTELHRKYYSANGILIITAREYKELFYEVSFKSPAKLELAFICFHS